MHDQMDHPFGRNLRATGQLAYDQKDHPVGRKLLAIAIIVYAGTPFVEAMALQSKGVGVMWYLYANDKEPKSRRGECMISGHPLMVGVEIPQSMADMRRLISNFLKKYPLYNNYLSKKYLVFRQTQRLKDNEVHVHNTHAQASKLQIFVKTLLGNILAIFINSSDSIKAIKDIIQDKEGINAEQQRLVMESKELYNSKTAMEYKIKNGSILLIMLKLKGGMKNGNISNLTENILFLEQGQLKDLLTKYELINYYPRFIEEKISLKILKMFDLHSYQMFVSLLNFKFGEEVLFKQVLKDIKNPYVEHFGSGPPMINNKIEPSFKNSCSIIELISPNENLSPIIPSSQMKSSKKKISTKKIPNQDLKNSNIYNNNVEVPGFDDEIVKVYPINSEFIDERLWRKNHQLPNSTRSTN